MKTKILIKEQARQLFNEFGIRNITLRMVAEKLKKSYGNITYHYATKEKLITELFEEMNEELTQLQQLFHLQDNLLVFFLVLPAHNFDITVKYLFFSKDYVELKRTYPEFFEKVDALNQIRQSKWQILLLQLQKEGYLAAQLSAADLTYIMELSVGIRMFYFQNHAIAALNKEVYILKVNKLLYPYLSEKGREVFDDFH